MNMLQCISDQQPHGLIFFDSMKKTAFSVSLDEHGVEVPTVTFVKGSSGPTTGVPPMAVLILVNPIAGQGEGPYIAETVSYFVRSMGWRCSVRTTTSRSDVSKAAAGLSGSFNVVIAIGGDGFVHDLLNSVADM
jgi:hypothetical protein